MTPEDLQKRVEASPPLQKLCTSLSDAVQFHADESVMFDPLLVIAVIGIIVNVLLHCRERDPEDIKNDIRNIRTLPPRKLLRLRRRMNVLWRKHCGDMNVVAANNPTLAALYEISEMADDEQLDALLDLADA
jgi:hypothetical protein